MAYELTRIVNFIDKITNNTVINIQQILICLTKSEKTFTDFATIHNKANGNKQSQVSRQILQTCILKLM